MVILQFLFQKRNEIEKKDHLIKAKPDFMLIDLHEESIQRTYGLGRRKEMQLCYIAWYDKVF